MKDYYKILGISHNATPEAIKRAYRLKAKKCHPDIFKGQNSKEQFQLINEAYQVLINNNKRRLYDQRLKTGVQQSRNVYHQKSRYNYNPAYQRPYYRRKTSYKSNKEVKYEKIFGNAGFLLMALIGIYVIVFGIYRMLYAPIDGVNSLAGVISGFVFTFIVIYSWLLRIKKK